MQLCFIFLLSILFFNYREMNLRRSLVWTQGVNISNPTLPLVSNPRSPFWQPPGIHQENKSKLLMLLLVMYNSLVSNLENWAVLHSKIPSVESTLGTSLCTELPFKLHLIQYGGQRADAMRINTMLPHYKTTMRLISKVAHIFARCWFMAFSSETSIHLLKWKTKGNMWKSKQREHALLYVIVTMIQQEFWAPFLLRFGTNHLQMTSMKCVGKYVDVVNVQLSDLVQVITY